LIEELLRRERELTRTRINSETAKIPWRELQRFFAAGKVMQVDARLDLVEVACAIHDDDVDRVTAWTRDSQLGPIADAQARSWYDEDATVWAVVLKPWVLVQGTG
jgi:hypothetical protein